MEKHTRFIRQELEKAALNARRAQEQTKAAMERLTELETEIAATTPDEWAFVKALSDASYHFALDSGGEDRQGYDAMQTARDLARDWDPDRIRELAERRPQLVDVESDVIGRIRHEKLALSPQKVAAVRDFVLRHGSGLTACGVADKLADISSWRGSYYGTPLQNGEEAAQALREAFIWSSTDEGVWFWSGVHESLLET